MCGCVEVCVWKCGSCVWMCICVFRAPVSVRFPVAVLSPQRCWSPSFPGRVGQCYCLTRCGSHLLSAVLCCAGCYAVPCRAVLGARARGQPGRHDARVVEDACGLKPADKLYEAVVTRVGVQGETQTRRDEVERGGQEGEAEGREELFAH